LSWGDIELASTIVSSKNEEISKLNLPPERNNESFMDEKYDIKHDLTQKIKSKNIKTLNANSSICIKHQSILSTTSYYEIRRKLN